MSHPLAVRASFQGQVELRPSFAPRPELRLAVFDFDGTLSWLRHGWPEIMMGLFRRHFPLTAEEAARGPQGADELLMAAIVDLNGKSTIFQMLKFVELAEARGVKPPAAEALLAEYNQRLDDAIAQRSARVTGGQAKPDDFVVHAARPLVEHVIARGLTVAILSSTIEERVRQEAQLLKLAPYFEPRLFGGRGDPAKFSKRTVFERLLAEERLQGSQLLSFGDGAVEISHTKELGGLAIAVCSDEEHNGSGRFDESKRKQLLAAGADAAVPDYRDAITLVDYLLGK